MTDLLPRSLRRSVLTAPARHRIARLTAWQPGTTDVPIDRLLLGEQDGVPAAEFADLVGDLLWPSRRVVDGPHAQLLELGRTDPTDEQVLASPYATMARACIGRTGRYFAATDDEGILAVARGFLAWALDGAGGPQGDSHSVTGMPVLAARIRGSDCYQVIDGHHRIAVLAARGETSVPVRVRRGRVTTPLQSLLRRMSWLEGKPELYQPLVAPELEAEWPVVRRCDDRLEAMWQLLSALDVDSSTSSYLDVASCYGWFVARMGQLGFDAYGMERDPLGPTVGDIAYDLDPDRIEVGDAVESLRAAGRTWDVVSCFSLLHHFVLGRGSCGPDELVRLLDSVTGRVLFLDTGQEHERWFRASLAGWDTDHVRDFLAEHTTFDRIVDLGPDRDAVPPYEDNYGRHLFACIREGR